MGKRKPKGRGLAGPREAAPPPPEQGPPGSQLGRWGRGAFLAAISLLTALVFASDAAHPPPPVPLFPAGAVRSWAGGLLLSGAALQSVLAVLLVPAFMAVFWFLDLASGRKWGSSEAALLGCVVMGEEKAPVPAAAMSLGLAPALGGLSGLLGACAVGLDVGPVLCLVLLAGAAGFAAGSLPDATFALASLMAWCGSGAAVVAFLLLAVGFELSLGVEVAARSWPLCYAYWGVVGVVAFLGPVAVSRIPGAPGGWRGRLALGLLIGITLAAVLTLHVFTATARS